MHEYNVALGLKNLISTEQANLVSGLVLDGYARDIEQLTTSILTPPEAFYFVSIDVASATMDYDNINAPRNVSHASMLTQPGIVRDEYEVAIYVMDYVYKTVPLEDATQAFEEEHGLFRTLTDRVVNLLDQTDIVTYDGFTFRIPGERGDEDRRIRKNNRAQAWSTDGAEHFQLFTQISFTVAACGDTTDYGQP